MLAVYIRHMVPVYKLITFFEYIKYGSNKTNNHLYYCLLLRNSKTLILPNIYRTHVINVICSDVTQHYLILILSKSKLFLVVTCLSQYFIIWECRTDWAADTLLRVRVCVVLGLKWKVYTFKYVILIKKKILVKKFKILINLTSTVVKTSK